jgi:hypothetical protein
MQKLDDGKILESNNGKLSKSNEEDSLENTLDYSDMEENMDDGLDDEVLAADEIDELACVQQMSANDRSNRKCGPFLPLLLLPGLRVTRLGRKGGMNRARQVGKRTPDPMERFLYRRALTLPSDDEDDLEEKVLELRGLCYAILAKFGAKCARLYAPRRTSLLHDVVINGTHLYMPDMEQFDNFSSTLYSHKGGADFTTQEKVCIASFLCFFASVLCFDEVFYIFSFNRCVLSNSFFPSKIVTAI